MQALICCNMSCLGMANDNRRTDDDGPRSEPTHKSLGLALGVLVRRHRLEFRSLLVDKGCAQINEACSGPFGELDHLAGPLEIGFEDHVALDAESRNCCAM